MAQLQRVASRAAVIGYGKYGRYHARKYQSFAGMQLCGIAELAPGHRQLAAVEFPDVPVYVNVDALLAHAQPDLASVAVPASEHYAVSRELLEAGVHVLVEKPMTSRRDHALELMRLARDHNCILQPGHLERFNHTLSELHARIPDPHYVEARRLAPWSGRGTDVDVVLDLMIHDIDMLMEIVEAPVTGIKARGVKVFSDQWDVANAQLAFENGCTANLTASRASPRAERRLHVFSQTVCALADIDDGLMLLHHRDAHSENISTERCLCRHEDPLRAEIAAFIDAIRFQRSPRVTPEDGYRAVDIALRITAAMENDAAVLEHTSMPLTDSDRTRAWLDRSRLG